MTRIYNSYKNKFQLEKWSYTECIIANTVKLEFPCKLVTVSF